MEHPPKIVEKVAPQNGFFQDFPSISPEHRHLRHRGTLQIPTVGLRKVAVGPLRQRFLRGHGDVHDDFHVGNPAINLPHPIIIGFTTVLLFFLGWTCYTFQDLPGSINGMLWVNQFDCLPLSFSLHGSSWIWSNQKSDHMISYVYDASDSMSMYVYIYIHHIYIHIYIYVQWMMVEYYPRVVSFPIHQPHGYGSQMVTDVPNLWPIAGNQTELENHPDFSRSCPWFSPLKPINCPWCSPFWIPWRGPPAFRIFIPWSTAASWPFTSGTIRNPWNPSERFRGFWVGPERFLYVPLCSSHPTSGNDAMRNYPLVN